MEFAPRKTSATLARRGGPGHLGDLIRIDQHLRIGTAELHGQLVDVVFFAAKAGGQRQRHGPRASIHRTAKQRREIRAGFRHQRHAISRANAQCHQLARGHQRIGAQLRIRVGLRQRAARIMEIETEHALGGIVQRIAKSVEIRIATWLHVDIGRGNESRLLSNSVQNSHAIPRCVLLSSCRPISVPAGERPMTSP